MNPQAKPASRRERKKERTRQEVYAAAMKLFADRSYHQVTVEEICEEADVARTTFFAHFPSKSALLREYSRGIASRFRESRSDPESSATEQLRALATLVMETWFAQAEVMGAIVSIFMLGLLPFTLFYVLLRGFYSLEDTRTPFFVTVAFSVVMLVLVVGLFSLLTNAGVTGAGGPQIAAIALGYVLAYWFGFVLLWWWLSHRLAVPGALQTGRSAWVLVRLVFAGIITAIVMTLIRVLLVNYTPLPDLAAQLSSAITIVVLGLVGVASFIALAYLMRVHEVSSALRMVKSKLTRS